MRKHTYLPAMVGFVRNHVAEHFRTDRPWFGPGVAAKLVDAPASIAESVREHLRATSCAFGESRTRLPRSAAGAVELWRNLDVWSCKPDPLGADVVHVREDRSDGANVARRPGFPRGGIQMLDQHLVDAIIGGKNPGGGAADLRAHFVLISDGLTLAHDYLLRFRLMAAGSFATS